MPILSVEIRDVAERHLGTLIEILSPANKTGKGADEYAERRLEILNTRTHLLEIDLLRRGQRIELFDEPPPAAFYVYLGRVQRRPRIQVWPIPLFIPLPAVPVPLLPPDPDISLDLQAAVDACFELVGRLRTLAGLQRPTTAAGIERGGCGMGGGAIENNRGHCKIDPGAILCSGEAVLLWRIRERPTYRRGVD